MYVMMCSSQEILQGLPPSLASDLSYFMYGKFLERMPMFRGLGKEVMHEVCKCVVDLCLAREQLVTQEGRVGHELYFLISGEVEVSRHGERLGFLGEVLLARYVVLSCMGYVLIRMYVLWAAVCSTVWVTGGVFRGDTTDRCRRGEAGPWSWHSDSDRAYAAGVRAWADQE